MSAYGAALSTQEIEDLVSFLIGKPFSAPPEGVARVPPLRSARSFRQYVARPYRNGNNLMPSYADLGEDALGRIAAFLVASRGRR